MKLWHDDIRRPPDESWIWVRTNGEAQAVLSRLHGQIDECSLDHDLGLHDYDPDEEDADLRQGWDQENDGQKLVKWMIATGNVPEKVTIHSWNPDGAKRMAALLTDVGLTPIVKPYLAPPRKKP